MKTIGEVLDDSFCGSFESFVEGLYNQKIDIAERFYIWLHFQTDIGHSLRTFVLRPVDNFIEEELK